MSSRVGTPSAGLSVLHLALAWETGAAFLADYTRGTDGPGSFAWLVPEGQELPALATTGAMLSISMELRDRQAMFHVHARVTELRAGGPRRGLRLEFLPEERGREELVVAAAEGEPLGYLKRRHPRIPCEIPTRATARGGAPVEGLATTISEGGLHLSVEGPLEHAIETRLELEIAFDGAPKPVRVRARVTTRIEHGPQCGYGVEFLFESVKQRDELVALLPQAH